jgi:hypothetical protein
VNGCIDDFSWCDVAWQGNRGWVFSNYLLYDYQDRRVPVLEFGAALGIGIVAFSIGDYWGRYYAGRPWYRRESYWMHRPPPPGSHRVSGRAFVRRAREGAHPHPAGLIPATAAAGVRNVRSRNRPPARTALEEAGPRVSDLDAVRVRRPRDRGISLESRRR